MDNDSYITSSKGFTVLHHHYAAHSGSFDDLGSHGFHEGKFLHTISSTFDMTQGCYHWFPLSPHLTTPPLS
jgi:hypothetical protein